MNIQLQIQQIANHRSKIGKFGFVLFFERDLVQWFLVFVCQSSDSIGENEVIKTSRAKKRKREKRKLGRGKIWIVVDLSAPSYGFSSLWLTACR
jgi:hypothetical protein